MHIDLNLEAKKAIVCVDGFEAYASFEIYDNSLDIKSTRVPQEIGGRGIAKDLVKACYDYALEHNLNCLATCSYAVVFLKRNPQYHGRASDFYVEGSCSI